MQFGQVTYSYLFFFVPVLFLFYRYAFKARDKRINQLINATLSSRLLPLRSRKIQKVKAVLIVFACFFIVVALLQPRWGFKWEEVHRRGVDIMIVIDVSESMLAEDVNPNRLERAKREINDLLQMVEGDRIGLIAFAGGSFVHCPLTLDYSAVQLFLDYINTDLIPLKGTAIGEAIKTGIKAFDNTGKDQTKALILITDGEDHEGDPVKAAKEAKEKGVRIFAIGIGVEGGTPIPDSEKGGFKKDANGGVIMTRLDELTLKQIALETGGSYVRSVTGDLDLEHIYLNRIKEHMQKKEFKATRRKLWEERFAWFVAVAFLFLSLEFVLSEQKG